MVARHVFFGELAPFRRKMASSFVALRVVRGRRSAAGRVTRASTPIPGPGTGVDRTLISFVAAGTDEDLQVGKLKGGSIKSGCLVPLIKFRTQRNSDPENG